ncbi:MAG: DUF998 domain-containing protein [archaeon]|jgi:hypothetical membrane protein
MSKRKFPNGVKPALIKPDSTLGLVIGKILSKSKVLALLGLSCFLLLTIYSLATYPNYEFFSQYLSDLGVGSTAMFFNLGVIICSILFLPLMFSLFKNYSFLGQTSCYLGIASMIFFSYVALFPASVGWMHYFSASLFFFLIGLFVLFTLLDFLAKWVKSDQSKVFFAVLFSVLSLVLIIILGSMVFFRIPFLQKISIIGIVIWLFIFVVFINPFEKRLKR